MIEKDRIRETIVKEKSLYYSSGFEYVRSIILKERRFYIWDYQKNLRKLEYYKTHSGFLQRLKYAYHSYRVNKIGIKLGIECWHSIFDEGLLYYHTAGGIIVNADCRIGKNCHLHGNNCIGNNGESDSGCPIIGDNCDIGFGASIIGNIRLGNNITIGAGAVVVNSCLDDGAVLVGIPAKRTK